jgi:hypothetical protein
LLQEIMMLFVPGMLLMKPRKFVLLHSLGFACGIFRYARF